MSAISRDTSGRTGTGSSPARARARLPTRHSLPGALVRLLGPAVDQARLAGDLRANADILRLVERLWDAPVDLSDPAPPFDPAWEDRG